MPFTNDQIAQYLQDPLSFPPEFKSWFVKYLEQHQPELQAGLLAGKLPTSKLMGSIPTSQLSGTIAPSLLVGYPNDPSRVLLGDGTWAGGMAKIYDLVASGSIANFDIIPIVGSYAHLRIEHYLRGDTGGLTTNLMIRLNNDSGANYDYQIEDGTGTSMTTGDAQAQTAGIGAVLPANTAGANLFGGGILEIPNYANASNNKFVMSQGSAKYGNAAGNLFKRDSISYWRNSAAITRVTLLPTSGNFVAGSRCTVYGIGA